MKKNKSTKSVGSIDKLLLNGTHDQIKLNIIKEIQKISDYCDNVIGEGYYGRVILSSYGPNFSIYVGDELISISVVIKEAKFVNDIHIDKVNENLIIYCQDGVTCESIILFMLSKSWYKEENIHMPLLVAMSMCDQNNNGISHIVLERCGLKNKIDIKKTKFFGSPSAALISGINNPMYSFMTNIGSLIDYVTFNMEKNMMCTLPNQIKINIVELIDTICIFYLHTNDFIWKKYKLTLGDQSTNNIFIHWINENSRCGKKKLDKLENIYYDIGNKYIKTKSNGMIFKIGDVGMSVMNPQNNVILIGNIAEKQYLENINAYKNKSHFYWDFIFDVIRFIPTKVMSSTIIYQIIKKYDISEKYIPFVGVREEYINSMPSEIEILNDPLYDQLKIDQFKIDQFKIKNDDNEEKSFVNLLF